METKSNESKGTVKSSQIGGALAEQPSEGRTTHRSKAHADSWRNRLFHDGFTREGRRILSGDWSVRLYRARRRETFHLCTPNAATASAKAQAIYLSLVSVGWDATIAKFKPESLPKKKAGTVGETIGAASLLATTRPQSFAQAVLRLRQIAAGIAGVKPPTIQKKIGRKTIARDARLSYRSPEFQAWRQRVDAVPLTVFTPDRVRAWRDARIAARAASPIEKRAATISADSTIRMARAIFSKRILAAGLGSKVELPTPLPFAGITVGGSTRRFSGKVDAAKLFVSARTDLENDHPEQFRAFSLCMLGGLRRSEADWLTWAQIDLAGATLMIERTDYFDPKSEESTRSVDLPAVLIEVLRSAKSDSPNPIFVLKGGDYRPQLKAAPFYRCDVSPWKTWRRLSSWLAARGISDGKPIHVLRKLAGSLIFSQHGLEQARGFLGHASVTTTSSSYLAQAKRVTVEIGAPADEVSAARAAQGAIRT